MALLLLGSYEKDKKNFFDEAICHITTNGNRIVQNEFVAYAYHVSVAIG